jgi:uncharacterized membrane protein
MLLCAVGFYASVFMLRKSIAAARGVLREPSVVQTARAKLFAGIPNASLGVLYYPALTAVSWLARSRGVLLWALGAAALAAAASAYLAYSLLFVTRRSCPYCWSAHIVNWALFVAVLTLLAAA